MNLSIVHKNDRPLFMQSVTLSHWLRDTMMFIISRISTTNQQSACVCKLFHGITVRGCFTDQN